MRVPRPAVVDSERAPATSESGRGVDLRAKRGGVSVDTARRTRRLPAALGVGVLLAGLTITGAACVGSPDAPSSPPQDRPTGIVEELPDPRSVGTMSLEEALARRRSIRSFTSTPLTDVSISQLLWAAQGLTADWGGRTAPSAGGLHPLEVYVLSDRGVWRYLPSGHRVEVRARQDRRLELADAAGGQDALRTAPAVFVICGSYPRTASRYGARAERYVHLEAGHAAQNLLLQAVALSLAAVPIGAFDDIAVQRATGLPEECQPLYLVPVGGAAGP